MTKGMRKRKNRIFPGRRISPGLLFSALVIAVSFIAMIVPLALFHSAQIAATSRLRTAVTLLLIVVFLVLFLGIIGHQPALIFGGVAGIFWVPIFAISLHQRMTLKPIVVSAILLCSPVFMLLAFAALVPHNFDVTSYLQTLINPIPGGPAPNAKTVEEWNSLVQNMQSEGGALADFSHFSTMDFWKRLSWFAYGGGSSWLLSALGVGLANLVFLDFAFEQIEKLRAVATYVQQHANRFSKQLIDALAVLMQHPRSKHTHPKRHKHIVPTRVVRETPVPTDEEVPLWSFFVRPPRANTALIWGHSFEFRFSSHSWRLRSFSLPFALVVLALCFLGYFALSMGGSPEIIEATQGSFAPVIAVGGILAFVVVGIVAAQGTLVLLERLTSGFLLVLGIVVLLGLSMFPINAHMLMGVLGILGVIDYAYDLRGHLANREKPV
jgi:hypothetical protein